MMQQNNFGAQKSRDAMNNNLPISQSSNGGISTSAYTSQSSSTQGGNAVSNVFCLYELLGQESANEITKHRIHIRRWSSKLNEQEPKSRGTQLWRHWRRANCDLEVSSDSQRRVANVKEQDLHDKLVNQSEVWRQQQWASISLTLNDGVSSFDQLWTSKLLKQQGLSQIIWHSQSVLC